MCSSDLGNIVQSRCVTADAIEIFSVQTHMNIQGLIRFGQGSVQIAVLDTVTAAAVKMTGAAVFATGPADTLGSFLKLGLNLFGNLQ